MTEPLDTLIARLRHIGHGLRDYLINDGKEFSDEHVGALLEEAAEAIVSLQQELAEALASEEAAGQGWAEAVELNKTATDELFAALQSRARPALPHVRGLVTRFTADEHRAIRECGRDLAAALGADTASLQTSAPLKYTAHDELTCGVCGLLIRQGEQCYRLGTFDASTDDQWQHLFHAASAPPA